MFKKLISLFKKSKPKIVSKGDDFIMFTSEEGMTEEESLQFIYDNLKQWLECEAKNAK